MPLRVAVSCDDPQSGVASLVLSLGTSAGADDLLDGVELLTLLSVATSNASNASSASGATAMPGAANASGLVFVGAANRSGVHGVVRIGAISESAIASSIGGHASSDRTARDVDIRTLRTVVAASLLRGP